MNIKNYNSRALSLSQAGLISGIALVVMTILSIIAMPSIQGLSAIDSSSELVQTISSQEQTFRFNLLIILIIVSLDALLSWSLYLLVRPVHQDLALLQGWLRMIYTAIFAVALGNLTSIPTLLHQTGAESQIAGLMNGFMTDWNLGLAIFGLHLVILGYVIVKSSYIPNLLGALVMLAGAGYMIDSLGNILFADYTLNVGMFTFFGEVLLGFWLLFKAKGLADHV